MAMLDLKQCKVVVSMNSGITMKVELAYTHPSHASQQFDVIRRKAQGYFGFEPSRWTCVTAVPYSSARKDFRS